MPPRYGSMQAANRPIVAFLLLLAIAVSAGYPLLTGARWIETALPGGLPLGNALAAIGLCAIAAAAMVLSPRGSILRAIARGILFAAVAWLPLSIALAGNLALNFSGGRGLAWIAMTLATTLCALLVLLAAAIRAAIDRVRCTRGDRT